MSDIASALPGAPAPYMLDEADGDKIVMFDQMFTLLTTNPETSGEFDAFFNDGPAGDPVPPHFHAKTHETFFVVSGAVQLWIDDRAGYRETRVLEAGGFGFVPRGAVHSYRMTKPSRVFGVTSGGFTDFFRAVGKPTDIAGAPAPDQIYIPDFALMAAKGAEHDVNFIDGFELWD